MEKNGGELEWILKSFGKDGTEIENVLRLYKKEIISDKSMEDYLNVLKEDKIMDAFHYTTVYNYFKKERHRRI